MKNIIKMHRAKKELTQQDLANEFDVTRNTIRNWERGITTPTVHQLIKLSLILDVTLEELASEYYDKEEK